MESWFSRDRASSSPTKPCCFRWPIPARSTGRPWRRSVSESAVFARKEPNNMTPESNKTEGRPDVAEADVTRRISNGPAEQLDAAEPEEKRTLFASLREAYVRARDGRKAVRPERQARTAKNVDRSKGLLVLAVAVVVMIFVFLGMFSSSSGTRDRATIRTKPGLGRTEERKREHHN